MRIGIAGVGGIGSNVAWNLVRAGVERLTLVDFDRVEESNLNRQFYFADQIGISKVEVAAINLRRIAPLLDVRCHALRLESGNVREVFEDCGVVVEGFDGRQDKRMLLEALADSGKPVVSASGVAGRDLSGVTVRRIGRCYVVGDQVTDVNGEELYSPKISLVASLMADLALRFEREES